MSALDIAVQRLLNKELTEDVGFEAEKELAKLRDDNKRALDFLYRLYHADPPSLELWQEVYRFLEGKEETNSPQR